MSIRARQTGKGLQVPIAAPVHLLGDNPVCAWDERTLLPWESAALPGKKNVGRGYEEF